MTKGIRPAFVASIGALLAASACGSAPTEDNSAAANAVTPAGTSSQAPPPLGCADRLAGTADRDSFSPAGMDRGSKQIDDWAKQGTRTFKSASAALCRIGKLDPTKLAAKKHLLIQYGGGADSAAVYEAEAGPADTIILQYAYSSGEPGPDEADVSQAILCWDRPDAEVCAEREP